MATRRCRSSSDRSAIAERHAIEIARVVEEPADAIFDHLRNSADARCHDRHLERHGFELGEPEIFLRRRKQEHDRRGQERDHVLLLTENFHIVDDAEASRETGGRRKSGRRPPSQGARHHLPDLREDSTTAVARFTGGSSDVNQQLLPSALQRLAGPGHIATPVLRAVQEIRNDADVAADSQFRGWCQP